MCRRKIVIIILSVLLIISTSLNSNGNEFEKLILGGRYINQEKLEEYKRVGNKDDYYRLERFFRPSNMSILNNIIENSLYDMYGRKYNEIKLSNKYMQTPEDTILNYFSILREAANPTDEIKIGCGSLGDTRGPYPVAYNFLSQSYKKQVSYDEYLKSFENKLHLNLVKMNKIPPDKDKPNYLKYFVELEIIEGLVENTGQFSYYYGYIYLDKEDEVYRIKDMKYSPENYLCAPYHGWSYDAKYLVEIEYGDWCSLVDGEVTIKENRYEKKVYFKDKLKNEHYVLFYQLTNGTDLKIADYKKNKNGKWELIYVDPDKCLNKQ